jgi:hypothetical protein
MDCVEEEHHDREDHLMVARKEGGRETDRQTDRSGTRYSFPRHALTDLLLPAMPCLLLSTISQ